ncbi:MAG: hypothetical protein CVU88_07040 [Firmicutes bacterium HGW-Firmicutes-13]|nr:MAG: hypothetical protein CVU88_07040 [Firmicutes bacterium HGW-Firmicutes-13]
MEIVRIGLPNNSYVQFNCSRGESVHVFQGQLSPYDIIIKYRQHGSRLRTPKHIHWVVDILLKKQADPQLTNQLLEHLIHMWNNCQPIINNAQRQRLTPQFLDYPSALNDLDNYGYYSTEFIVLVAELLMVQEKTNNPEAYMFYKVLNSLLHSNDLFSIISTASFRGR